jgi:hypothetical protein
MKIRFLKIKSSLLIIALGLLGFTSCGDDDDIHPEYGVKVVRDKQIKEKKNSNDAILNPEISENEE